MPTLNVRGLALQQLAHKRRLRARPNSPLSSKHASASILSYIICTNPRSGSWLLSEGLGATRVAGRPREWFNTAEEQAHRAQWRLDHPFDLDFPTYLCQVRKLATTDNGICGIKLHYYQFADLPLTFAQIPAFRKMSSAQILANAFPGSKYLWLTRRDKVGQAISLQLASETNEWWAIDGVEVPKSARSIPDPAFDPRAIARMERILLEKDREWQSFFRHAGIEPLVIEYEELAADYTGTMLRALQWLGVPNSDKIPIAPSRLKKQANERTELWRERYRLFKQKHGPGLADTTSARQNQPAPINAAVEEIPAAWKQWVGQKTIQKSASAAIVQVLTKNGYSESSALSAVRSAAADPFLLGAGDGASRICKSASMLSILGQLASLESDQGGVERRTNLSRSEFLDRYYAANRPVIMQGLMSHWRAVTAWTAEYLKTVAGDQPVEVMTGRDDNPRFEIDSARHRTSIRFADFVDMVYSGKVTNDYYMVANNRFLQQPGARPLFQDFSCFAEYLEPKSELRQTHLWFGPAGTITPLHHDTSNILMAQVHGRKRYRLIPASQRAYVYNSIGVFSDVDCENPDLILHPQFRYARLLDVVLNPGEVLFMPVGWWHHVRALDLSITVSFTNFVFPNRFTWEL
jgi:LPS sulfotransferase NodH